MPLKYGQNCSEDIGSGLFYAAGTNVRYNVGDWLGDDSLVRLQSHSLVRMADIWLLLYAKLTAILYRAMVYAGLLVPRGLNNHWFVMTASCSFYRWFELLALLWHFCIDGFYWHRGNLSILLYDFCSVS
jgi:hypothetical protein